VTGGDDAPKTSIYNPATGAWLPYQQMNIPRGYQVLLYPTPTLTLTQTQSLTQLLARTLDLALSTP